LRLAPDVNVRVATETVGGRKRRRPKNLHRFRTPCCTPTVRLNLDLALPNGRNAPGRMPPTKGPAWHHTAHSKAKQQKPVPRGGISRNSI
jgi:hypothetical protein